MFLRSTLIGAIVIFACVYAQAADEKNLQDIQKQLEGELPDGLQLNTSAVPSIEQAENIFKEKCLKNSNQEAFDAAMKAREDITACVKSHINNDELQKEMEEAKPHGNLDEVFKKYCEKTPLLKQCFRNFLSTVEPCLDSKEQGNIRIVHNITDSLANFICFKEGDRIALFIAEGGPECLAEKNDKITACINSTLGQNIDTANLSLDNLPQLVFEEEQCDKISKLQECVVKELESCKEPTPANIAESLFKFIKKVTPCSKLESSKINSRQGSAPSSANMLVGTMATVMFLVGARVAV